MHTIKRCHGFGLGRGPLCLVSSGRSTSNLVLPVQCPGYGVPQWCLDVEGFFSWSFLGLLAWSITFVSCHLMGWWCFQACSASGESAGSLAWGWSSNPGDPSGPSWPKLRTHCQQRSSPRLSTRSPAAVGRPTLGRRPGDLRQEWKNTKMLAAGECWRSQLWQNMPGSTTIPSSGRTRGWLTEPEDPKNSS